MLRYSRDAYLAGAEYVVEVLEESFVLDFVVCEDERDALALCAGRAVQELQVVHQIAHIVRSATTQHHKLIVISSTVC